MLELVFFTSNRTKLAHLRYLSREYDLKITGFHQKTYNANYSEPRLQDRGKLLEESYQSAVEQAKKGKINPETKFFFLEDTSVVIEALSSAASEVPGLDVKYWMQENTFDSVDQELKRIGNNRKATVRSDIILNIPSHHRKQLSADNGYLVFTGMQQGHITTEESVLETNLVYPWLDNKTFNKWFIPDGANKPISLLPIDEANNYDFRAPAFRELLQLLESLGLISKKSSYPYQQEFDFGDPLLLVCGFPCAGKTTISQYLVRSFDYIHIEASDFMYLDYYTKHGVESGIKIGDFAEKALREKPEIVAEKILEYLGDLPHKRIVISGFRDNEEINWLVTRIAGKHCIAISFILANQSIRFDRYNKRKRLKTEINLHEFKAYDEVRP